MTPIASLPMYDWPEVSGAFDRLWTEISHQLSAVNLGAPEILTRVEHPSRLWTNENLIIGQTCGWPYANTLRGKAIPFARFHHDLHDCPPGNYHSVYIGQSPDDAKYLADKDALLKAGKIAINGNDSQSGFQVFREITGEGSSSTIPESMRYISGAHRNSIKAVAEGAAKIAAIDAVAFELAKRHDPGQAKNVTVIGRSSPLPGLPLITSVKHADDAEKLFHAVSAAVDNLDAETKDTLLVKGVVPARDEEYKVFL